MATSYRDIELSVEDPVAILTLNRPKVLNAFTYATLREIRHAIDTCRDDERVVGILITGKGRAFCAGLDMSVLAETTSADSPPQSAPPGELPGLFSYFIQVPKPIVACLNGVAAGGGFILAMLSDLRFAAEEAQLTTTFVRRGLIAEHGSSWLLPRLVGVGRALDLLWTGDKISAREALRLGLVDRVVPASDLLEEARRYVARLAQTSAPRAIAESKRLVYRHLGMGYEAALREAEASQNRFVVEEDAREGARSFIERRPPRFRRVGRSDSGGG
jgi:enoyl-CoA hydratase/carnithine racemase